jgi:hypothetical protein
MDGGYPSRLRIRSRWGHAIDKSASRTSTLGWSDSSIPPLRDQPTALVRRHLIFVDRSSNSRLLVGCIINDADQLRGRAFDVIDGPGVALLFGWSLGHQCSGRRRRATSELKSLPKPLAACIVIRIRLPCQK